MRASLPILLACLLAACGQTGPLYLPDEGITTPVEIRSAPTPPPAADTTASAEADRERADDEPAAPPP